MSKEILVNKDALFRVLQALVGPTHILNEMVYLQQMDEMIKSMSDENPIDTLIKDYQTAKYTIDTGRVALGAIINGIKISEGDVVDYEHNEAGGGIARKEVIFDDNYGVLVERPYNCSKYYNLAGLKFKVVL